MSHECALDMEDLPVNDPLELSSLTTNAPVSNIDFSKREKFLRLSSVRDLVPYSRATIYRNIAAGTFPRPIALGPGAVAWRETEILEWMRARIASSAEVR